MSVLEVAGEYRSRLTGRKIYLPVPTLSGLKRPEWRPELLEDARERLAARFLRYVKPNPETGCGVWTDRRDRWGYGLFRVKRRDERTWLAARGVSTAGLALAHRVAYALFVGIVPVGLHVLHCCPFPDRDDPACTTHLYAGTNAQTHRTCATALGREA